VDRLRCYRQAVAQRTTSSIAVAASCQTVMAVIADVPAYPEWTPYTSAEVLESGPDGLPVRANFCLRSGAINDEQVMAYTWQPGSVTWEQVTGRLLRSLHGVYRLVEEPTGCLVTYELMAEPAIPMIGALRRRAEKVIVDTALKGLKERAESLG